MACLVTEMIGGGSLGWKPGEFTDDTQMAIVLGLSLLERGGFDGADVFARFRGWAWACLALGWATRVHGWVNDRVYGHDDLQR